MIGWLKILRESPIDWLLEKSNPSVRYFALIDILGRPADDPEVMGAKKMIPESAVVQRILRKQHPEGYWEKADSPYLPKYRSSYWTIMVLGHLGTERADEKVANACEFIFQFQQDDGGFSSEGIGSASREYEYRRRKGRKLPSKNEYVSSLIFESQLSCLTGNMASALTRIGYANDPRVKKAIEWLVRVQNKDGGWLCPYWKAHSRDKHGCFMGTICPMEAFSITPKENLTEGMEETISKGAEFLLMHHFYKADHHNYETVKQAWLRLSFPWFGYNILRGLDVLTKLGYVKDHRADDAVRIILQKRQSNGAWILEDSPVGRMQSNLETKGQPSKWITLIALRMLKRLDNKLN
ncbi:MAG TPA: prenyltransferase/squalene oxidase repeat-containing protein [candidate division Zixibacteria bacterium]|nr:prenyltransferase/squalene oxidase repeat-containing protein [candidate division Zixibacteria bacterium]